MRDVMIGGPSGILATSPPDFVPTYTPTARRLTWPNGSMALAFSADSPDQLRGPQSHFTWVDELASFNPRPDPSGLTAWDNALISTRLGSSPSVLVTTTPRRTPAVRAIVREGVPATTPRPPGTRPPRVALHAASTFDNAGNLAPDYVTRLVERYRDTALFAQEVAGVLVDEVPGALFAEADFIPLPPTHARAQHFAHHFGHLDPPTHALPDADSVTLPPPEPITILPERPPPAAILIGVDPGVTTGGDATGIVTVLTTLTNPLHSRYAVVLADDTEPGLSPDSWASRIVDVVQRYRALDAHIPVLVVAESNQGGELVRAVISAAAHDRDAPPIPVALAHASRSKAARAESIVVAARAHPPRLFVAPHAHRDHGLDLLAQEATEWEPNSGWSPNRMDALVHAARAGLVDPRVLTSAGLGEITVALVDGTIHSPAHLSPTPLSLGHEREWRGRF